ncbi:hypothetical protein E3O19_15330 [Cryobacterium algoritolerans]|uniref:Uncharacterized protein n=1 Tax=Cryobacterium algoritolerans TaxID=1259184 RepID=A0A4R8WKW3_9MICO|nr:hypothetical protein [Cryobacterium algoritolerans]TFC10376.1 hypothetical protein E3O19_15330 [Cryobacterium algoritolerans]
MSISPRIGATVDSMGMSAAASSGRDIWMWAAHGIAAVLTIAALHRGEKAVWFLVDLTASGLAGVLRWGGDLVPVVVRAVQGSVVAVDVYPLRSRSFGLA